MRWLGLSLVVLLIAAGILQTRPDIFELPAVAAKPLNAARSASDAQSRRIFAAGTVEGAQREVPLRFEISGRLVALEVAEGDQVEQGQVLAELDPQVWEHRLAEAQARLRLARAERDRLANGASPESREVLRSDVRAVEVLVREAEALFGRGKRLATQNAISTQELDEQRYRYEKVVAQLHAARARLQETEAPVRKDDLSVAESKVSLAEAVVRQEQTMLEKTHLRAPTRGIVLHIPAEAGELVGPNDERELVIIVNCDRTRVRAYIEELDALRVHPGQTAEVTADGRPGKKYQGRVKSCALFVRPKSHKHLQPGELTDVRVREVMLELTDAAELVIGLPVDVFIAPPRSSDATTASNDFENQDGRTTSVTSKKQATVRSRSRQANPIP